MIIANYAVLATDGTVINVIRADTGYTPPEGEAVRLTPSIAGVSIGDKRVDGKFVKPTVQEPTDTVESLAAQLADILQRLQLIDGGSA